MRIALGVEYDGRAFHGWQTQSIDPAHPTTRSGASPVVTVQQVLEQALSRVANAPVRTVCAGRTDTGVHATGQVVHFDAPAPRPERAWLRGVGSQLPAGVRTTWVREVADDFHARFSASARTYRYLMLEAPLAPAIGAGLVTHVRVSTPLDVAAMQAAARPLLGEHDFTSFRAAGCQSRTPMRHLQTLEVRRQGRFVVLEVTANAFLMHMVRNLAGSLLAVGQGERSPDWPTDLLATRDRTLAAPTAPAAGLYLVDVAYPQAAGVPSPTGGGPLWLS